MAHLFRTYTRVALLLGFGIVAALPTWSQVLLKPAESGDEINLLPPDLAALESDEIRRDLPCTVNQHRPELGFDLRFHTGYEFSIPLRELAGAGDRLTVLFRVRPASSPTPGQTPAYFVQHFNVPTVDDDAKGDAVLQGAVDVGEGSYHVDWLIRDRSERLCSYNWDLSAELAPKEKTIPLLLKANQIAASVSEPFSDEETDRPEGGSDPALNVKLLVNFSPQNQNGATLQRSDTDALVSIMKAVERDPHVRHISLVAFNIDQGKVLYRQEGAEQIDFPALGKALQSMQLGTVNLQRLSDPHSQTTFLEDLIQTEMSSPKAHPDAVVFAGPKAMLNADVPQEDLRRIANVECPVFYLNYNLNPQANPWKDTISHAIRVFKGTEYTISRPRDLWFSKTEMFARILRSKKESRPGTNGALLPDHVAQTSLR